MKLMIADLRKQIKKGSGAEIRSEDTVAAVSIMEKAASQETVSRVARPGNG